MRVTLKHGLSYRPEYRAWQTMRHRCTCESSPAWESYGGRGITICDRWLNDPAAFLADMGARPSPNHEIDRIDNDGGYSQENCRWVLRKINDRNRRSNRTLTHDGRKATIAEWAERTGLSHTLIIHRIDAGWTTHRTLTTPARNKAAKGDAKHNQRQPCADCGKPVALTSARCITCSNKCRGGRPHDRPAAIPQAAEANASAAQGCDPLAC